MTAWLVWGIFPGPLRMSSRACIAWKRLLGPTATSLMALAWMRHHGRPGNRWKASLRGMRVTSVSAFRQRTYDSMHSSCTRVADLQPALALPDLYSSLAGLTGAGCSAGATRLLRSRVHQPTSGEPIAGGSRRLKARAVHTSSTTPPSQAHSPLAVTSPLTHHIATWAHRSGPGAELAAGHAARQGEPTPLCLLCSRGRVANILHSSFTARAPAPLVVGS